MSMSQVIESIEREAFEGATQRQEGLVEHRCPCGRLLGKFAGRAEVKCPKCGKTNVIGNSITKSKPDLLDKNNWKSKYQQAPFEASE